MRVFVEVLLGRTTANVFEPSKIAVQLRPVIPDCHVVAGGFDDLLETRSTDLNACRGFAGNVPSPLPGVRENHTCAVMEEIKKSTHLHLEEPMSR